MNTAVIAVIDAGGGQRHDFDMDNRLDRWKEVCRWPGERGGLDMVLESERETKLWVPGSSLTATGKPVEDEIMAVPVIEIELGWKTRRTGETSVYADPMVLLYERVLRLGWGMVGRRVRIVPRMQGLFDE